MKMKRVQNTSPELLDLNGPVCPVTHSPSNDAIIEGGSGCLITRDVKNRDTGRFVHGKDSSKRAVSMRNSQYAKALDTTV